MKNMIINYKKTWSQILGIRTLFSALLYATLLFVIVLSKDLNSSEYLYLEVYNTTLLYIIVNMLLFTKDILSPKAEHIFSKEFIEVLLITVISTILIISLFTLRNIDNAYTASKILIQGIAILVVVISCFIYKITRIRPHLR